MEELKSTELQYELLKNLNPDSSIEEMLTKIVKRSTDVLKASACTIYIIDKGDKTATQRAGTGYHQRFVNRASCKIVANDQVPDNPTEDEKLGLAGWIISTGKSFLARSTEELSEHPHWSGKYNFDQLLVPGASIRTFLGVPLRGVRGEVIGLIKAERCEKGENAVESFSVKDQLTLEMVARTTSKCLMYMEEIANTKDLDTTITAWTRDLIAEAAATEGDLDYFLRIVVNVVASAMSADSCSIYLIDESGNTLTQRAGTGSQTPKTVIRSYPLPPKEQIEKSKPIGITAWIASTGRLFYARNNEELRAHPHHRGAYDPYNYPLKDAICGVFLGLPLKIGGTVTGVIKVENICKIGTIDSREFSREAQRRFDLLAQDIAIAIMSLQELSRARYSVISDAQPTIIQILRGGMYVPQLVEKVVKETANLFNAKACALFMNEGNLLIQPRWAAIGYASRGHQEEVRTYYLVEKKDIKINPTTEYEKVGLTVWIAVMRQKFYASSNKELIMHPHHKGTYDKWNFEEGQQCESFMGVPLIIEDKLIGVLKVETKKKKGQEGEEFTYFSDQDKLVFDLIANSVAIAIENARLLESQRLAEHIKSHSKELIIILHDFVKDNLHATSTLYQVADLTRSKTPTTAKIIEHYAGLLHPDFNIEHLKSISNIFESHKEFYKESYSVCMLYRFFADSIEIPVESDSLNKILDICRLDYLRDIQLLDPQFILAEATSILRDMCNGIAESSNEKGRTVASKIEFEKHLKKAEDKAKIIPNPEKDIICRITKRWLEIIETACNVFHYVKNPYVAGLPINPSAGSPFFGRTDIFKWIAENIHGANQKNVLVLHGERRVGKTSILLQLEKGKLGEQLREKGERPLCPVYIDLRALCDDGTYIFLYNIAEKICRSANKYSYARTKIKAPSKDEFKDTPYTIFNEFMRSASNSLGNILIVLMFDEYEMLEHRVAEGKLEDDIFGELRHLMQFCPNIAFILAGTHQMGSLSSDYSCMVSGVALHKEVSFIDDADARALIQDPVSGQVIYEEASIKEIQHTTHNHPYLLQLLCYELISRMNHRAKGNMITLEDVNISIEHIAEQSVLSPIWEETTETEKMVFSAISQIVGLGRSYATQSELSCFIKPPAERASNALEGLLRHHLIEKVSTFNVNEKEALYRPTMNLFSRWVQRHPWKIEFLKE
jgi:GAF domain-containing protein